MRSAGLRVGIMAATVMLVSGCATFLGEDPGIVEAEQQQAERAEQSKYDQLQSEAERLRSEIQMKQSELENL